MDSTSVRPLDAGRVPPSPSSNHSASGTESARQRDVLATSEVARKQQTESRRSTDVVSNVSKSSLEQVADDVNRYFSGGNGIRFQIAGDDNELIVQVIDPDSEEVIRTIPPERLLSFRDHFRDVTGVLLDDQA